MVSTQTVNLSVLKAASKPHSSPHRVLLASVALLALYSVPLFSTVLPPLFDYPNHLARFAVLAAGGSEFYEVRWAPLPNLAGDIIVPLLARAMPLEIAGKLFLVMIFALILGGTASLNRVVGGAWRLWPLLQRTDASSHAGMRMRGSSLHVCEPNFCMPGTVMSGTHGATMRCDP